MNSTSHAENPILIVDDERPVRETLLKILSLLGYAAIAVCNGREAMETFDRHPFDLVITDLDMPEVDGLKLASFIKESSPHTPVVLITGNGLRTVQEGAVDVVVRKPFTLAELKNTVHALLHREDRQ